MISGASSLRRPVRDSTPPIRALWCYHMADTDSTRPKRESILLRAEPGTKAAMQAKADMAGLSVAEWHRRVVMAAINGGTIERAAVRAAPTGQRSSADAKRDVRPRPKGAR